MASNVQTSAGTRIYHSATLPSTYDKAGFEALTWTEINEVTDLGEFGRIYNMVTHIALGNRRTVKRKGSFDDGTIAMVLGRDSTDTGQDAMLTALDSDDPQAFKIVLDDVGSTHLYLSALVSSFTYNVGSTDQITGGSVALDIDNDILAEAPPTP